MPDGRRVRLYGVPTTFGLPDTKRGAQEAELREVNRVISTNVVKVEPPVEKEVPTVRDFATIYLDVSRVNNKPSSVTTKRRVLKRHLIPQLGDKRLDQVDYAAIEDLKIHLATTLCAKSINNILTILRRMLVIAKKRGIIDVVPEVEWLKAPAPSFDFLTFDEAERVLRGADGEWGTMLLVALRTGLRHSELIGLRWEDVDLVAGQLSVRQAIVDGHVGTPKSGRGRHIPLGDEVLRALKRHRHLRGPLVFCVQSGRALKKGETKHPLWRACKRAGIRRIGWHACRHTFASHLVMRGVTLKAVQELLGHATITMTMRYAHLAPEIKRDAVRLLDSGVRGSQVAAARRIERK